MKPDFLNPQILDKLGFTDLNDYDVKPDGKLVVLDCTFQKYKFSKKNHENLLKSAPQQIEKIVKRRGRKSKVAECERVGGRSRCSVRRPAPSRARSFGFLSMIQKLATPTALGTPQGVAPMRDTMTGWTTRLLHYVRNTQKVQVTGYYGNKT